MKKVISSIVLSSMLFMSTGCVSETLGLNPQENTTDQTTAYQDKENEYATKVDKKVENKIDTFFNKMLDKAGL